MRINLPFGITIIRSTELHTCGTDDQKSAPIVVDYAIHIAEEGIPELAHKIRRELLRDEMRKTDKAWV